MIYEHTRSVDIEKLAEESRLMVRDLLPGGKSGSIRPGRS